MDDQVKRTNDTSNARIKQQIVNYLKSLPSDVLLLDQCKPVKVLAMTPGAYNLNYHVVISDKRYVFRVNIQQQSGLANQIDYEFKVMKFLEPYQITARVFHMDNTKSYFGFDVLIEEYLEGPWVSLEETDMEITAELLVKLHSIPINQNWLITWKNPLVDTLNLIESDLKEYKSKKSAQEKVISLTNHFLKIMRPRIDKNHQIFSPDGLNHTDVAIDNFVKTAEGLKLIDWEKPRVDDSSYDVCCFLAEPAQLWCKPKTLSKKGRQKFLDEYIKRSGKNKDLFLEKIKLREPLVALHWVFWGMNRLCDLKDQKTASELHKVHEERIPRWERIADEKLIEKIIDGL